MFCNVVVVESNNLGVRKFLSFSLEYREKMTHVPQTFRRIVRALFEILHTKCLVWRGWHFRNSAVWQFFELFIIDFELARKFFVSKDFKWKYCTASELHSYTRDKSICAPALLWVYTHDSHCTLRELYRLVAQYLARRGAVLRVAENQRSAGLVGEYRDIWRILNERGNSYCSSTVEKSPLYTFRSTCVTKRFFFKFCTEG